MTVSEIINDPLLRNVLDTSAYTRDQCLALLSQAESNPIRAHQSEQADPYAAPSSNDDDIHLALRRQQKLLNSHLAQLRGLNRDAILRVRQTKQSTAEARQEVDRLHLQLQNLYYKQRHLDGEIAACEAYDHKYQQLPLIPVEDFLTAHPEHVDDDENALMIARINHEHAEREALEQVRQGLLKKKQGLIADNKKRKDDLANLDKDLETFIDAAKPIQKTFEKEY
ncbi:MAG: hypothetical protein M1825_000158 [Sarcosagium campestre]|nr:MAG: hypothetical protein M1825_000158 [Sarcosagium campestre]